jgi:hypothetical protein
MSRDIHATVVTELSEPAVKYITMVDLRFDDGSLCFNSSLRSYSYDSKTFLGAGNLGSVSTVQESTQLSPATCDITLSGVNTAALSAILGQEFINRRVLIYTAFLDDADAIVATPFIYFDGLMDSVSVSYGRSPTISIGCRDRLSAWDRDKQRLLTDAEQKSRHPTDKGLEFVNPIADREIIWPAASWGG